MLYGYPLVPHIFNEHTIPRCKLKCGVMSDERHDICCIVCSEYQRCSKVCDKTMTRCFYKK